MRAAAALALTFAVGAALAQEDDNVGRVGGWAAILAGNALLWLALIQAGIWVADGIEW